MIARYFVLALAAAVLMQPPGAAQARVLTVPSCGGAAHLMIVPGDPADPKPRRDCAKACHVIGERRGKRPGSLGCC